MTRLQLGPRRQRERGASIRGALVLTAALAVLAATWAPVLIVLVCESIPLPGICR